MRPGLWQTVQVSRTGRRAWLYVNDQPPVEGITPGGFTRLSLSQPLYLGGLPPESPATARLQGVTNLQGCIQKVTSSRCYGSWLEVLRQLAGVITAAGWRYYGSWLEVLRQLSGGITAAGWRYYGSGLYLLWQLAGGITAADGRYYGSWLKVL